jgi:hypothetical protein
MSLPLISGKIQLVGTLTIANGQTDSAALDADAFAKYEALTINGPAALTGTVTVQVGTTDASSPTWNTLQSGGVDVGMAATKSITISPPCFPQFRMHSSGAEGADRVFTIWGRLASVTTP